MSINKTYAVFGLGRYGSAVARELSASGADVIAVDIDMDIVNNAAQYLTVCKCADVTDADALSRLGIANVDTVIIAMADNLEASVLATMLCKEAGVGYIIVKCSNETHKKILLRVGADKVVFPESESGTRLAKNLMSAGLVDIIELSRGVSMLELDVRPEWTSKSLRELDLRKKYAINVVAIKENGTVITDINPESPLRDTSKLIVIANNEKLAKLK